MEALIKVENLCRNYTIAKRDGNIFQFLFSRKYSMIEAVKNITFDIRKGELVGFIGPNGAGKSTTIKMLTGILMPTSGTVSVLGNDPFTKRKQNAYDIGVVFGQRSQLWWDLPVNDTFTLLKKIYKVSDEVYERNIALYGEYLDVKRLWTQPVRQLSLGERMRAEIAAAMLHDPKILFLDEPTIGLDIVAKRQIRKFILKLNEECRTTVILTTHDMKDIEEVCERIILIDKGVIVIDTVIDDLKSRFNRSLVVNISFTKPVDEILLTGLIACSTADNFKWRLEFEKTAMTTGSLISEVSKIAPISDIEIKGQAIEDIVHDLYKGAAGNS
jgi:ABC-2 type transport system ATP-binding protein